MKELPSQIKRVLASLSPCAYDGGHFIVQDRPGNPYCNKCGKVLTSDEIAQIKNDNKSFPFNDVTLSTYRGK